MNYKVTHTTTYAYTEAVPVCHNEVHLTPRSHARQICARSRIAIRPVPNSQEHRLDYFGNHVTFFSVQEGHRKLTVCAMSQVEVQPAPVVDATAAPAWEGIRDRLRTDRSPHALAAYQFAFDSPFIKSSADLRAYAERSFPAGRSVLIGALDLTRRIYHEFKYDTSATTISTPLADVLRDRRGVCQDFAHLQIGMLRSLGLAARYVSGYLLTSPPPGQPRLVGSDASHAWLSIYCGDLGWIDLDPTNNLTPSTGHVTLAWGRDYSDVCPIKGVFVGGGAHRLAVAVDVQPIS